MKIKSTLIFLISLCYSIYVFADASVDEGKKIFTSRCNSCHNVNAQLVGPALANVDQRHTLDWIVNFVHSPKAMIEKQDKAAVALFNQFNQITMPDHPDLTADDIKNILAYIKSDTKTASASDAPFVKPGRIVPNYHPLSFTKNAGFFFAYFAAVLLLAGLLIIAVTIKDIQRKSQEAATENVD